MINRRYGLTVVEIVLVVLVVGLIAGLGWLYYDRSPDKVEKTSEDQAKNTVNKEDPKNEVCKDGDVSASEGVFCAQDAGVKLSVPDVFKGKFAKIDNYNVTTQPKLSGEAAVFGKSIVVYQAEIKQGNDTHSMTIAKEPVRTFKVRSFTPSLFDRDTKKATDDNGKEVKSIAIDGKKFYSYGVGDAGTYSDTYTAVTGDELTVISFSSKQQLGPDGGGKEFDVDMVKDQFNSRVKNLELL